MADDLYSFYINELAEIKRNNQYRFLKTIQTKNDKYVFYNNKKYINLSSNDYLGLATDKEDLNNFYSELNKDNIIDSFGLGSTSSRLLTGDFAIYSELENIISSLYNKALESETGALPKEKKESLVFNSGYHTNIGVIPTLTKKNDLILSDQLNHASIIDGTRLSRADCLSYDHLNYDQVDSILKEKRQKYDTVMIISESVFSMDGDIADIKKLVQLKNDYNAILYIDEAHAVGLFGDIGLGICEREKAIKDVDIIIGTFGKSLASQGAYAVLNPILKEYLINNMRTLLYTTALPPVIVNWNMYNMAKLPSFRSKREKVLATAQKLRESLIANGIKTGGETQIVPAIIGDREKTLRKSADLQERNFLVFPIRPPTVPEGTSRIRISLTANIDWEDIQNLADVIK